MTAAHADEQQPADPPSAPTEADSNWTGVPTMPGAEQGRRAGHAFLYAVRSPFATVEHWYRDRMQADAWTVSERLRSATSLIGGGPFVSLDFARAQEQVNVMLIFSLREQHTMVMLTRLDNK